MTTTATKPAWQVRAERRAEAERNPTTKPEPARPDVDQLAADVTDAKQRYAAEKRWLQTVKARRLELDVEIRRENDETRLKALRAERAQTILDLYCAPEDLTALAARVVETLRTWATALDHEGRRIANELGPKRDAAMKALDSIRNASIEAPREHYGQAFDERQDETRRRAEAVQAIDSQINNAVGTSTIVHAELAQLTGNSDTNGANLRHHLDKVHDAAVREYGSLAPVRAGALRSLK